MNNEILWNDEAISPVLGAILILAIGITIITNVQLNFIPVWNAQEELNHLKKMNDDIKELKSSIESSILSGTALSLPLSMGFEYSPKMIVYNPVDSAYAALSIQNNTWAEVRYNEVFPEGMDDTVSIKNISTSTITYTLQGTQDLDPFIYEHGLIRRSSSNYTASSQTLIANSTIYLLSIRTTESKTTSGVEKRTVNIYPTSRQKNSVIGMKVWLTLHTRSEYVDWWSERTEKEGGKIKKIDRINGTIIAYFDSMIIRMGEAYITASSESSPPRSPPYRLVKVVPQTVNLPIEGITSIAVEVQDYYNNPVPNVMVNFSINTTRTPGNANPADALLQDSAISGADGRANVMLKTKTAGFYYIDASLSDPVYTVTFVYPASAQGEFLSLEYTGSGPEYLITATIKDGLGISLTGNIFFDISDGTVSPATNTTDGVGYTRTTLDTTAATGIRLTDIQSSSVTSKSSTITWRTVNNITVTAKSGYIFNSIKIPAMISSTGCVQYGTSPGNYSYIECDAVVSSHSVDLTDLEPYTAYYFIVNSSRPGGVNVNSSEYMFITGDKN